jgi:hypothetical protein
LSGTDETRARHPSCRHDVWNEKAATFAEHWGGLAGPARHVIADALEADLRIGTMETLPWEDGILAVAAPFRRRDGSYRFENVFRYVLSSPSRNPTPART